MDRYTTVAGQVSSHISSGECAAAAARAAAANLIFRINYENVTINHSNGSSRVYPVKKIPENCTNAQSEYMTVMEGGAAPDIRDRASICVSVSRITDLKTLRDDVQIDIRYGNLFLQNGDGIAALDKNALRLVFDAVADCCEMSDGAQLLLITVKCPEGMLIAAKQAMGQSAFSGGITLMGTDGTLLPVHMRDISDSIDAQIRFQTAQGIKSILVSPGRYCAKKIADSIHVDLKTSVFCYNFPGHALDKAVEEGVENLLLVGNVGKLVKLAAGIMNTNSTAADARKEIFAAHVSMVGGTAIQAKTIMSCMTVDEILALLGNWGLRDKVMQSIMMEIDRSVRRRSGGRLHFGVALFSEQFGFLGQTPETRNVLVKVSQEQYALSLKMK